MTQLNISYLYIEDIIFEEYLIVNLFLLVNRFHQSSRRSKNKEIST